MIEETLEEFIKYEYSFMDCGEGCWKGGDDKVIAISTMNKKHLQHCINMVENWHIDLIDNQYKDKIEKMLENKLNELKDALVSI